MNKIFYNNSVIIIDNFFDNFDYIKEGFKNDKLFKKEDYPDQRPPLNWPGYRSMIHNQFNPFLWAFFVETCKQKIGFNLDEEFRIDLFTHLRTLEDDSDDYIHTDGIFAAGIVYLSETNMNSGTKFYDENDNEINTVSFVQNRAIFFNSNIPHRSWNGHGKDLTDGRLTLNAFIRTSRDII